MMGGGGGVGTISQYPREAHNRVVQTCSSLMENLFCAMLGCRHAGEGGMREQAPLLPFSWGSRGSKSALFKCNDLFSNC